MNQPFDPDKYKNAQKTAWSSVAEGWHQWMAPSLVAVNRQLIHFVGIPDQGRVLDLACGDGSLALAAAASGAIEVTAADLAPAFGPIVERLAQESGVKGRLRFQESDMERLPFEDRQFDVVFCQFGLMFAPNRKKALREIYRTLKPQGAFAAAVWAAPEQTTGLDRILHVLQDYLPPRPEGAPSMFECGAPNLMATELHSIGFREYQETTMEVIFKHANANAAWNAIMNTGPVSAAFSQFDEKTRKKVKDKVKRIQAKFKTEGGAIEMPAIALLFQAKRGFETLQP